MLVIIFTLIVRSDIAAEVFGALALFKLGATLPPTPAFYLMHLP